MKNPPSLTGLFKDLALQMVRLDFGEAQVDWTACHIEYAFDSEKFERRLW
jgi:hypothetical protein